MRAKATEGLDLAKTSIFWRGNSTYTVKNPYQNTA
jgi:hypothetical protein